jgi:hypothetical protein
MKITKNLKKKLKLNGFILSMDVIGSCNRRLLFDPEISFEVFGISKMLCPSSVKSESNYVRFSEQWSENRVSYLFFSRNNIHECIMIPVEHVTIRFYSPRD